jgi:hypothetical protein
MTNVLPQPPHRPQPRRPSVAIAAGAGAGFGAAYALVLVGLVGTTVGLRPDANGEDAALMFMYPVLMLEMGLLGAVLGTVAGACARAFRHRLLAATTSFAIVFAATAAGRFATGMFYERTTAFCVVVFGCIPALAAVVIAGLLPPGQGSAGTNQRRPAAPRRP